MNTTNTSDATITVNTPAQVSQPTSPLPAGLLLTHITTVLEAYIKEIVTSQVNDILTNHRTMRVIDDGFKEQVTDIAQIVVENAISQHNDDEYHLSEDTVNDLATSAVEDHDFDNQISQAVNDAINEYDFSDVIASTIKDNITFSVTVD